MAEKRMFAKSIIDSDAFLDMPISTQCLYFHLSMRADDDGFVNNPKKIAKMINTSDDDLKILFAKKFIITFDSGVIVVTHWRVHNTIQKDRYKPSLLAEKAHLRLENTNVYTLDTKCIQLGYTDKKKENYIKEKKPTKSQNTPSSSFKKSKPDQIFETEDAIIAIHKRLKTTVRG